MSFLKAWEIYPSDLQIKNREQALSLSRRSSVRMSLQPVIPGGVLSSSARFRFTGQNQHAMVSNKGQGLYSKWQPVPNFAVSPQGCTPGARLTFSRWRDTGLRTGAIQRWLNEKARGAISIPRYIRTESAALKCRRSFCQR